MNASQRHSPYCHKCPYNGKQNKACLSCKGFANTANNGGRTFISIDSHNDATNILQQTDPDYSAQLATPRADGVTALPPITEKCLIELLTEICAMTPSQLAVFQGMLKGENFNQIAARLKLSKMAISFTYRNALHKFPWLAVLMNPHQGRRSIIEARLSALHRHGVHLTAERLAELEAYEAGSPHGSNYKRRTGTQPQS